MSFAAWKQILAQERGIPGLASSSYSFLVSPKCSNAPVSQSFKTTPRTHPARFLSQASVPAHASAYQNLVYSETVRAQPGNQRLEPS